MISGIEILEVAFGHLATLAAHVLCRPATIAGRRPKRETLHCTSTLGVLVKRNFSAQTYTYEHSERCSATSLIICVNMQNKHLNKASYLRITRACFTLTEWYCKTQRIQRFFYLEIYLKNCQVPTIYDRHKILYSLVHLPSGEVSAPSCYFNKAL